MIKRAMILAAGLGTRMGALTQDQPKPLLTVKGHALIEHLLHRLAHAGIVEVVINVHYHAEKIIDRLGDGASFGVNIQYSYEKEQLLGTGGGVEKALPLLGDEPFILVSGDIMTDFDFKTLPVLPNSRAAHLILVNNPEYKKQGDFALNNGLVSMDGMKLTYANIALISPRLFEGCVAGSYSLAPLLVTAIERGLVSGHFYNGYWFNVGTEKILNSLNEFNAIPQMGGCPRKQD
jgi:N-acetyl-alpha-D-muramate 1-phosphate uridylyltransferase